MSNEYRAIRRDILDDESYMEMSLEARHLFLVIKLHLGKYGIAKAVRRIVQMYSGIGDGFDDAVAELVDAGWLRIDGNVWWLVKGLKNEPKASMNWAILSHVNAVGEYAESLPDSDLVSDFLFEYSSYISENIASEVTWKPTRLPSRKPASVSVSVSESVSESLKTKKEVKDFSHLTEWFEDQFWPLYRDGVKASGRSAVGKGKALTALKKLNPDEELKEVIISHLTERAAIDQQVIQSGNEPTFWKDAERWIKSRGWEDELVAPKRAGSVDDFVARTNAQAERLGLR